MTDEDRAAAAAAAAGRPGPRPARLTRLAPAKVNLTLRVRGRRPDGYHLLDSLVVFPRVGDLIEVEPSATLGLTLDGPHGFALGSGDDNLVLKAAAALRRFARDAGGAAGSGAGSGTWPDGRFGAAIRLVKHLPIAGGVGGGSSDAAATLRLLLDLWEIAISPKDLDAIALSLGADVPVCLRAPAPARLEGVGDRISPAPDLPEFWLVLVNPGAPLSTQEVFRALEPPFDAAPSEPPSRFGDVGAFVAWLEAERNDLERPAIRLRPVIADVLATLARASGCRLARMSGSGATCFGVFEEHGKALAAADRIAAAEPSWWTTAAPVPAGAGLDRGLTGAAD